MLRFGDQLPVRFVASLIEGAKKQSVAPWKASADLSIFLVNDDLSTDFADFADFYLVIAPNLRNLCNLWLIFAS